jgi:hypothetical protein
VNEKFLPSANTTAFNGFVFPLQSVPVTVPAILPQPVGGVTFMVTPIGAIV